MTEKKKRGKKPGKQPIASFSMPFDMQDKLTRVAKKKGLKSKSQLVRDLVDKYVNEDDDIISIVLKVPAQLRGNVEALQQWFTARIPQVVQALGTVKESPHG